MGTFCLCTVLYVIEPYGRKVMGRVHPPVQVKDTSDMEGRSSLISFLHSAYSILYVVSHYYSFIHYWLSDPFPFFHISKLNANLSFNHSTFSCVIEQPKFHSYTWISILSDWGLCLADYSDSELLDCSHEKQGPCCVFFLLSVEHFLVLHASQTGNKLRY